MLIAPGRFKAEIVTRHRLLFGHIGARGVFHSHIFLFEAFEKTKYFCRHFSPFLVYCFFSNKRKEKKAARK